MFAVFGLGWAESIVLAFLALLFIGVPLFIFRVLPSLQKSAAPRRGDELADLRAQVEDLRDEVERLKRQLDQRDAAHGITADGPK